jgi:large subunit ribosomal protein L7/L12
MNTPPSFRITAPAYGGPSPAYGGPPVAEPPTEHNVVLEKTEPNTVRLLKLLRDVTGIPLAEAKRITDEVRAGNPQVIMKDVPRANAQDLQRQFEQYGSKIRLA